MKKSIIIVILGIVGYSACALLGNAAKQSKPFDGVWLMSSNGYGIPPIHSIMIDGAGVWPITNWLTVTSASTPRILTHYLNPPRTSTAAEGQLWFNGSALHVNVPEVRFHPAETNGDWSMPAWSSTNDWPEATSATELICVLSITKGRYREVKGLDYYAVCRVRMWSGSTAYTESDSILLVEYLTNKCTRIR